MCTAKLSSIVFFLVFCALTSQQALIPHCLQWSTLIQTAWEKCSQRDPDHLSRRAVAHRTNKKRTNSLKGLHSLFTSRGLSLHALQRAQAASSLWCHTERERERERERDH